MDLFQNVPIILHFLHTHKNKSPKHKVSNSLCQCIWKTSSHSPSYAKQSLDEDPPGSENTNWNFYSDTKPECDSGQIK